MGNIVLIQGKLSFVLIIKNRYYEHAVYTIIPFILGSINAGKDDKLLHGSLCGTK